MNRSIRRARPLAAALLLVCSTGCASSGGGAADPGPPRATREEVEAAVTRDQTAGQLVAYGDPADPSRMLNAFTLPAGLVAVWTYAVSEGGRYAGERFGVSLLGSKRVALYDSRSPTVHSHVENEVYATVTPLDEGDAEIEVTSGGQRATLRLSDLVRWRLRCITERTKVGERTLLHAMQGRDASHVWFTEATLAAGLDPEAPWRSLAPTYVTPVLRKELDGSWTPLDVSPIGDTGYVLRRSAAGSYDIELAR